MYVLSMYDHHYQCVIIIINTLLLLFSSFNAKQRLHSITSHDSLVGYTRHTHTHTHTAIKGVRIGEQGSRRGKRAGSGGGIRE